jgi:hypothetical protein
MSRFLLDKSIKLLVCDLRTMIPTKYDCYEVGGSGAPRYRTVRRILVASSDPFRASAQARWVASLIGGWFVFKAGH